MDGQGDCSDDAGGCDKRADEYEERGGHVEKGKTLDLNGDTEGPVSIVSDHGANVMTRYVEWKY
jgi:hypothetical protein